MRLALATLATALFVVGCKCGGETPPPVESTDDGGVPRVAFSAQPWLHGGRVGAGSGSAFVTEPPPPASAPSGSSEVLADRQRATQAGYDLHDSAAGGCNGEQKCIGDKCGKLCTQWMTDTIKTFRSVGAKNDTYFNCFGGCLGGRKTP